MRLWTVGYEVEICSKAVFTWRLIKIDRQSKSSVREKLFSLYLQNSTGPSCQVLLASDLYV